MQLSFYGRLYKPSTGRVYAEVYKTMEDDGLTLDEQVSARRTFTTWGAKKWIDKTIIKLRAEEEDWFYIYEWDSMVLVMDTNVC